MIDGPAIENGAVLFEEGQITAVGKVVVVPEKAIEIDGTNKHVYPGLIESMSDIGLREISAVEETDDRTEHGDRNPNARSWIAVNPDSELLPVARAGGVLVAMTAPRGRWLRGQAAVIQSDGWTVDEMAILAPAGLYVDWGAMHPRDDDDEKRREKREQKLAELDALLDEARRYGEAREKRPDNTPTDLRLESLLPVINGDRPLIAEADLQPEIESAVAYALAQNLRLVIHGGYDAVQCANLLKQYQVSVIVGSTYRLPLRRDDPYDTSYTLPLRLREAGVRFAIAGEGAGSPGGAAKRGIFLTTRRSQWPTACHTPRRFARSPFQRRRFWVSQTALDRSRSEKTRTLIVADGDILETETNVTDAYIQGRRVDLGSRHKTLYEKYKLKYSRR